MKSFKYRVIYHSFFSKPEEFIVNTLEEVKELKDYAKEMQYKATIQEGEFVIKDGFWYDNNLKTYI